MIVIAGTGFMVGRSFAIFLWYNENIYGFISYDNFMTRVATASWIGLAVYVTEMIMPFFIVIYSRHVRFIKRGVWLGISYFVLVLIQTIILSSLGFQFYVGWSQITSIVLVAILVIVITVLLGLIFKVIRSQWKVRTAFDYINTARKFEQNVVGSTQSPENSSPTTREGDYE